MNDIKKISELKQLGTVKDNDLFIVSKTEQYGSFSSKNITYGNIVQSLRKSFKEELDNLAEINDNFVDDRTLDFRYDSSSKKIILETDGGLRTIDATDFIYDGMIDSVTYDKTTKKITITFNTKSGKSPIVIDISDLIDVYSAGYGLCCENAIFKIDEDVVSKVGHKHTTSDINDFESKVSVYEKIENLGTAAYTESSEYAPSTHYHDDRYYQKSETSCKTDLDTKFNEFKELSKKDLSEIVDNNTIKVVDEKLSCAIEIPESKSYNAGRGLSLDKTTNTFSTSADYVTYVYVVQNLSSEEMYRPTIFKDWTYN